MNMQNDYVLAAVAAGALIVVLLLTAIAKRLKPAKLNTTQFKKKWDNVQSLCKDKSTWPLAIINGDKLVDEALKKHRYKGKTMGERLVAAQHDLSDNDGIWHAHKLRNKLVHEDNLPPLKKRQVMDTLIDLRQALKDLGALK